MSLPSLRPPPSPHAIRHSLDCGYCHLHAFEIVNPATGQRETIGIPDEDWADELPTLPGCEALIARYFGSGNRSAGYLYDFGDSWAPTVTLEAVLPRERSVRYPVCLAGRRARPPEDCGGVYGYEDLLRILADPEDEEHETMLEWVGGSYDPSAFDAQQVRFDDPGRGKCWARGVERRLASRGGACLPSASRHSAPGRPSAVGAGPARLHRAAAPAGMGLDITAR